MQHDRSAATRWFNKKFDGGYNRYATLCRREQIGLELARMNGDIQGEEVVMSLAWKQEQRHERD